MKRFVNTPFLSLFAGFGLAASTGLAVAQDAPEVGIPSDAEAPIAILVDVSSGQVLHAREADRRFVPASMTKAMTTFLAFELMGEGLLDPKQLMRVNFDTWQEWNGQGSTMWLPADANVRVDDLLRGITTVSANDGSIVLAEGYSGSVEAWTAAMNDKALSIGMTNSRFGTPNGWPDEGKTFTTARDLVTLGDAMIARHPIKYGNYVGQREFRYNDITQANRDPMIGRVEGADGIKTGYTNEAGFGFLGTAKRNGRRLVMVIAGARSQGERARLAREYIEWGFSAFDARRVFNKADVVGTARVQGGSTRSIGLVTDRSVFVAIPETSSGEVRMSVAYDGPLRAPLVEGDSVAELRIEVDGMPPASVPLLASETVEEANPFERLINGFAGWFS